jgi:hypothetical protein
MMSPKVQAAANFGGGGGTSTFSTPCLATAR